METVQQVPQRVKIAVEIAITQLREIARGLENARRADTMFAGNGRYEWEVWTGFVDREKRINGALAVLQEFRLRAAAKGIDPEQIINELGGVPAFEPSAAIDSWLGVAR